MYRKMINSESKVNTVETKLVKCWFSVHMLTVSAYTVYVFITFSYLSHKSLQLMLTVDVMYKSSNSSLTAP